MSATYREVVDFVRSEGTCRTGAIQNRFQIGFNKASSFVQRMEDEGIVGPWNGSGRDLLRTQPPEPHLDAHPHQEQGQDRGGDDGR